VLHLPDSLAAAQKGNAISSLSSMVMRKGYQRKVNLTVKEQKNLPLKLTDNVLELARYSYSDLTDGVVVLQHDWVCSALFMLYKHQNKFLEGGMTKSGMSPCIPQTDQANESLHYSTGFY